MTIKAQSDPSYSDAKCPRCGQPVTFRKDMATIYPHRDELVGAPCPMGGVELGRARRLVREHRERLKDMAR